jgi:hypothetical protein
MDFDTIFRMLKNAGFNVLGTDGVYIHLEDPSCILRSFETFLDYAWIAVTFIAGLLLFGWAIAYIRGSKYDSIFENLRNLTLIFGILAAVKPAVGLIWGGDIFARGCRVIRVSIAEVQKILDTKNSKLKSRSANELFEEFDIYDSGAAAMNAAPHDLPYEQAPLYGAGDVESVSVAVDGGRPMYPMNQSPIPSGYYDGTIWGGQCTASKTSSHFTNQSLTTGQFAQSDPVFEKAINTVFRAEGGYVNDPYDSGGETKYGVSKNNNPDVDVRNLTRAGAEQIAYQRYYKKYNIDRLPDGIRGEVFQVGWGCGPVVAIKQLQGILGVPKTGAVDSATISAAQNYKQDLRGQYLGVHKQYLIGITERKPTQKKFLNGWMKRAQLVSEIGCHS